MISIVITNKKVSLNNISFFEEDNVATLKRKLATITNIPQYRQHLHTIDHNCGPLYYKIYNDSGDSIDIQRPHLAAESLKTGETSIQDLAVDVSLFDIHEQIVVEAMDNFITLGNLANKNGELLIEIHDLDDFINDTNREAMRMMAASDDIQLRMIYHGFITKYWPMLASYDVFLAYLRNEMDIYPDLSDNRDLRNEIDIMNIQTEFWRRPPTQVVENTERIDVNIKSAVIHITRMAATSAKTFTLTPGAAGTSRFARAPRIMNPLNIFNSLPCSAQVPIMRLQMRIHNKPVMYTRMLTAPTVTQVTNKLVDTGALYEDVRQRLAPSNLWRLEQLSLAVLADVISPIVLTLHDDGNYQVKTSWGDDSHIGFKELFERLDVHVAPLIRKINNMGRAVFINRHKLPELTERNARFSGLNLSVTYKHPVNDKILANLDALIKTYMDAGLLVQTPAEERIVGQIGAYYFTKGVNDIEKYEAWAATFNGTNQYVYLTDAKQKQKWPRSERYLSIHSQSATSFRVDVTDLREEEFGFFKRFVICLIYRACHTNIQLKQSSTTTKFDSPSKKILIASEGTFTTLADLKKISPLKLLRSRDPALYAANKTHGTAFVYSRICQKDHQPLIFDEQEYNALEPSLRDKTVKYYNYTTQGPAWYLCPNAKFPYLNFIVGQHPDNYCIPCCKKTPPRDEEEKNTSKRANVYHICMECHKYSAENASSHAELINTRYIMNYGKIVDASRIGQLPDIIIRYLEYHKPTVITPDPTTHDEESPTYTSPAQKEDFLRPKKTKFETAYVEPEFGAPNPPEAQFIVHKGRRYSTTMIREIAQKHRIREIPVDKVLRNLDKPGFFDDPTITFNAISPSDQLVSKINNTNDIPVVLRDGFELLTGIYAIKANVHRRRTDINVHIINDNQLSKAEVDINGRPLHQNTYESIPMNILTLTTSTQNCADIGGHCKYGGDAKRSGINADENVYHREGYYLFGVLQDVDFIKNLGAVYSIAAAKSLELFEYFEQLIGGLTTDHFMIAHHGILPHYFGSLAELKARLQCIADNTLSAAPTFNYWNELFIELTELVFGDRVLLIEEVPTSDRVMLSTGHLRANASTIILWRHNTNERTLFGESYNYYPIFRLKPLDFFKRDIDHDNIVCRMFTADDILVKIILDAGIKYNVTTEEVAAEEFAIFRQEFDSAVPKYRFTAVSVIYEAVLPNGLRWPLRYVQNDDDLPHAPAYDAPFQPPLQSFETVFETMQKYNRGIIVKSELKFRYVPDIEGKQYKLSRNWHERAANIIPIVDYLRIDRLLHRQVKPNSSYIIGFIDNRGMSWFCAHVERTPESIVKIIKAAQTYELLDATFKDRAVDSILYKLYYEPETIERAASTVSAQPAPHSIALTAAYYDRYLYDLFVIEIFNWISTDDLKNWHDLALKNDRAGLLRSIVTSCKRADIFVFGGPPKGTDFPYVFTPCSNCNSATASKCPQCKTNTSGKGKLIMIKSRLAGLQQLLCEDFCNPLKRETMAHATILANARNQFGIVRRVGEEVYVRF
jgi:hypothetical protein